MLIFQPPVIFCSDENIQTIFGIKLKDFLNYGIDYNSISQTVEKVVKKIFLGRRNNSTSSGRQSSAIVGSTMANCIKTLGAYYGRPTRCFLRKKNCSCHLKKSYVQ
jgi:hypothetical protein